MRLAARLKIKLNELATPDEGTDLEHYLQPRYFDEKVLDNSSFGYEEHGLIVISDSEDSENATSLE